MKKIQRAKGIESNRDVSQLALDAYAAQELSEVKVFALKKPGSERARIVCSYGELDRVQQIIVRESLTAAHAFQSCQYAVRKKSRQMAVADIVRTLRSSGYAFGGELDSVDHFVHINPDPIVEWYGIDAGIRDCVITNRRKETGGKITLANALARSNRAQALSHATRGLPQGAASSSVIASAAISDAIGRFLSEWGDKVALFNYADNFYLFTKTEADWESASQDLIASFSTEEGLTLRLKSPCTPLCDGLEILGLSIVLVEGERIAQIPAARLRQIKMGLRRKMHELLAAIERGDSMLDQIYFEAVSVFINKLSPFILARQNTKWLMEFFGGQLMELGQKHDVHSKDLLRLVRFMKRHLPSYMELLQNRYEIASG